MSQRSPTVEGFRAAFRRPSLSIAEIVWRWSVGATATALFLFGFFEYLNTLPVTNGEVLFLRTRHPYLVAEAMAHILRGSLNRGVMALLLAALLVGLLWMVAASVGRIATVRVLLDYFRRDVASNVSTGGASIQGEKDAAEISSGKGLATRGFPSDGERDVASNASTSASFVALVRLQFLRAAVALAGVFGFMGAAILAGFASPDANPQPGLAFFLFLPVAALICWVWWCLNWLLSLAGMFAVRDGEDAVAAIAVSVAFCRERTGAVFAVSTWTVLAHLVAFVGATTVASVPLGFAGIVPWRLVVAAEILVTLAYFALADWLYMARLAGYVCIAEMPQALLAPLPAAPLPKPAPPVQTTIDRDEPILSDVPGIIPASS
jgi:hypothetical protein